MSEPPTTWIRAEIDVVDDIIGGTEIVTISANATKMPAIIGLSAQDAKASLSAAGVKYKFVIGQAAPNEKQKHFVYQTEPASGASLEQDKPVQVFIYGNIRKQ